MALDLATTKLMPLENIMWQYRDDKSNWKCMPYYYSDLYETKFRAGATFFSYEVVSDKGRNMYTCEVSLARFVEHNKTTATDRRLRRMVAFL